MKVTVGKIWVKGNSLATGWETVSKKRIGQYSIYEYHKPSTIYLIVIIVIVVIIPALLLPSPLLLLPPPPQGSLPTHHLGLSGRPALVVCRGTPRVASSSPSPCVSRHLGPPAPVILRFQFSFPLLERMSIEHAMCHIFSQS